MLHSLLFPIPMCISLMILAGLWKTFIKAGIPGWWAILPILNIFGLIKISRVSAWTLLLLLVPIVNGFFMGYISIRTAKAFEKGVGYGLGLFFLPFVFFPLLGFGNAIFNPSVT